MTKKKSEHYVNNKEFTNAVYEYVERLQKARKEKKPEPQITDYIGESVWKICERLSRRPNFVRYHFRDEMVSDAIENCLKAVSNYNIDASTRSGNPNAYGYFTQIAYYAMVRRIQKEEKEERGRIKMITQSGIEAFVADGSPEDMREVQGYIEDLKSSTSKYEQDKDKSKGSGQYGWSSPAANKKKREEAEGLEQFSDEEE